MNTHFPISETIRRNADMIISILDTRAEEVKKNVQSQSFIQRITLIASRIIGLAGGLVMIACLPIAAAKVSIGALSIAFISFSVAMTCFALYVCLNPRSPGETIVQSQWKSLFTALRSGNGIDIIQACNELIKQKRQRTSSFDNCLNKQTVGVMPFIYKSLLIGYLLLAIENLMNGKKEEANTFADNALGLFEESHLPKEIKNGIKAIKNGSEETQKILRSTYTKPSLQSLDSFLKTFPIA